MTEPVQSARVLLRSALFASVFVALFFAAGCVRPQPADVGGADKIFEHLYQRDLPAFERELAMKRRQKLDVWTAVGEAWMELATCANPMSFQPQIASWRGPATLDPTNALGQLLYETLALEISRRNANALRHHVDDAATIFSTLASPAFFKRKPPELPDRFVRWPNEREAWVDETLAAIPVENHCPDLEQRLLKAAPLDDESNPDAEALRRRWMHVQLTSVDRIIDAARALPDDQLSGHVALLLWRIRLHGADLAMRLARSRSADEKPHESAELHARGLKYLSPLGDPAHADELPDASERAQMFFLRARLRIDASSFEDGAADAIQAALNDLDRALNLGLDRPNADRARYLALKLLTDAGRWSDALKFAEPMPAPTSPLFEPFAYRLALAARQAGADDRFLRIAMEALAGRTIEDAPFLRALQADVLQELASYEFDERVVEILENLGPRNLVYRRVAEVARMGLRRGYPDHARAACRWLLLHHRNYRFTPIYHGLLAVAAFQNDDEEEFRARVHAMTRRDPQLVEALGESRRAAFFSDADQAFARLMGTMLPAMAEWGDGRSAKKRRQRWLGIVVDETQRFLRSVDRSRVRPDLNRLYILASKLLREHPRGYAARVGAAEPTPLVLGTVQVAPADLAAHERRVEPSIEPAYFLSLIPRETVAPARWSFGWPDQSGDGTMSAMSTPQHTTTRSSGTLGSPGSSGSEASDD
jgi:hypothetical protein